jgi:putative ABC transport system permease protein
MFQNYFKIAWRSLFKNKFHTSINLVGLVIGFTIGLLVLLMVYGQFSYDKNHANRKRIFQVYNEYYKSAETEIGNVFGYPAGPAFKEGADVIEKSARFKGGSGAVLYNNREIEMGVMVTDEDFLSMFSFPVVKGNKSNPLKNLSDIVITETSAEAIFGKEEPVGKTIKTNFGDGLKELTVSAVVKDIPRNSSIQFRMLARIENVPDYAAEKTNWNNQHHAVFVMLKKAADKAKAEQQMRFVNQKFVPDWSVGLKKEGARPDKNGDVFASKLVSLADLHFSPKIASLGGAISKAQVFIMLGIGMLIILIACFNFVNINLANAFTRSKEIGVRKCLGAAKHKLFAQLWSESFLLCLVSFVISLLLVNILIGILKQQVPLNMPLHEMLWKPSYLLSGVGLLLLVSFIAGGYPSLLMTRFRVVETLKGKVALKKKSLVRSSLIVAQFVIACIMISCTLIIYKQFKFLQNADLGLNSEHIISIPLKNSGEGRKTIEKLRSRLSSNSSVVSITGSSINIGLGLDKSSSKMSSGWGYKDGQVNTNIAYVDYDYLKTLKIKILEGKDIEATAYNDTLQHVILTEGVAKQLNEQQLAGRNILVDSSSAPWHIEAIIPDFHLYSLREEKEPLTLILNKTSPVSYCFVKVNAQNKTTVMDAIKKEMALLEPGREFKGSFIDDNIQMLYKQEQIMSIVFSTAAGIAIVLSCVGLLAMVLLMIQQRVKEIGVRKVLGANVSNISFLISKDFLSLVLIAVLIATPIAWLAMNKWLQEFAYRIEIHWWMFVIVALVALLIAALSIGYNTVRAAMQNPVKSLRTE